MAVIVAIQLTTASSLAGFETALNTVSGRTSLEIEGTGIGVDELRLPFDAARGFERPAGQPFGPRTPAWTYRRAGFYSAFLSGAQRLPNGNTLICAGTSGHASRRRGRASRRPTGGV